jgi:hypothetical protein
MRSLASVRQRREEQRPLRRFPCLVRENGVLELLRLSYLLLTLVNHSEIGDHSYLLLREFVMVNKHYYA